MAKTIAVTCPTTDSIKFIAKQYNHGWDRYHAISYATTTDSNLQLPMACDTDSNVAYYMDGASYIYNGTFICTYYGEGIGHDLVMANSRVEPILQNCHFRRGDKYECFGNRGSCILDCEA